MIYNANMYLTDEIVVMTTGRYMRYMLVYILGVCRKIDTKFTRDFVNNSSKLQSNVEAEK